ncbi:MAG: sensor domain-containing diguanylate cyclase [Vallitaleaceae bacterium]|nr:sensor domain-containing diguanylate cyclase [Vallitaleaceae bacterium]
MNTILLHQKKVIMIYTKILILLFIYFFSAVLLRYNLKDSSFLLLLSCALIMGNLILYRFSYFQKVKVYILIKMLSFILFCGISFYGSSVISAVGITYGILHLIELYIFIPSDATYVHHVLLGALVTLAIAVGLLTRQGNGVRVNEYFALAFYGSLIISCNQLIITYRKHVLGKLKNQVLLFEEAERTNQELMLTQNKFKIMNEETNRQKCELEEANEKLNKMTAEIYTQNELLRYISQVLDINELIDMVTDAIIGTIGVDTCSLVLFDQRTSKYFYSVKSNYPGKHLTALREVTENHELTKFFNTSRVHLNNHVFDQEYKFTNGRPVGSIAIIPLVRDDSTYGLLIAEHSTNNMFTESNVQFFRGISTQITIAVNNANIYALVEEMARKDGLTGLFNRKYLQDKLQSLARISQVSNHPLTVALFDIDNFKSINDRYGHSFGDEVICMVGKLSNTYAQKFSGIAARYGGEEFVIVFPGLDLQRVHEIIHDFHQELIKTSLLHGETQVHINISVGISTLPYIANSPEDLLLRADNAMYYAKKHGKGRIILDDFELEKVV